MSKERLIPEKRLAAVCGLFCPACSIYIGSREDPERLKAIARTMGIAVEDAYCNGCRSDVRIPYCRACEMEKCAARKGLDFCGECDDFPCAELKEFQAARPHRIELWESQRRIREVGWEKWYEEMAEHFACPNCGVANSAYDRVCRACGASPSCGYVRDHQDEIKTMLARLKAEKTTDA
ncbi:MAG: DUF3795 domain-containing protein [Pseudomonadota bacterium]